MNEIYQLKEMLCKELEEYGSKGELTAGTLDIVDKLAHAIKNLDKIIEAKEDEGYSGRSYNSYRRNGYSSRRSYARNGRYTNGRYSMDDGMIADLRSMMNDATDEKTRQEFERFIAKMEAM